MPRDAVIETMPPTMTGRASPNGPETPPAEGPFHFHALLYPNRSLSKKGFRRVLALLVVVCVLNAFVYFTVDAWPVALFSILNVPAVWLAFTLSYASGRRYERVVLTDDALWVSRVLPSGHETRFKLSPFWARVDIERPVVHETQLKVIEKGRTLILGSFLAPQERGELAEALANALSRLRMAGHPAA